MSDNPNPGDVNPNPNPPEPPAPKPEKTFLQDEVTRIATQEKEKGERTAAKKIADDLGMTIEEAKALIDAKREQDDADKSALEKLQSDHDKLKSKSEKETTDLKTDNHTMRIKLRLLLADVPLPEEAEKKTAALDDLARFLNVDQGASDDKIDEGIGSLKEKFPQLWGSESTPPAGGTPNSLPASGNPTKPPVGKSALEQGKDRAAEQLARRGIKTSS